MEARSVSQPQLLFYTCFHVTDAATGVRIGWVPAGTYLKEVLTACPECARPPRLLDLFCGAGGAAMGYHRAGFEVVGVDIKPQPHYPFEFHQADAMTYPLDGFDAIHASPPCQAFTLARVIHGRQHPDLLTPTRIRLLTTVVPWVIENVPGAPMRADLTLCGSMFGEPRLKRHRLFEFNRPPDLILLPPCGHARQIVSVFGHGGHVYHGVQEWREVMGIDWMTRDELSQAIPPAYTEHIGKWLVQQCARKARPLKRLPPIPYEETPW